MDDDLRGLRRALEGDPADRHARAAIARALRRSAAEPFLAAAYEAGLALRPSALEARVVAPGPLLLLGGSGATREALARALHAQRDGAPDAFSALSAATDHAGSMEIDLLGHSEPGASAQAVRPVPGLLARDGTVFLDRLEDALEVAQVVLDALRTRWVVPVTDAPALELRARVVIGLARRPHVGGVYLAIEYGLAALPTLVLS